jgi:hypothetical protein
MQPLRMRHCSLHGVFTVLVRSLKICVTRHFMIEIDHVVAVGTLTLSFGLRSASQLCSALVTVYINTSIEGNGSKEVSESRWS